jgi:hypothetical protein
MDSTAIQTEAETSLLLLERRLEKEPAQRVRDTSNTAAILYYRLALIIPGLTRCFHIRWRC